MSVGRREMIVTLRYIVLSPSDTARRSLLTELFGASIELHPSGEGERVVVRIDGTDLEIMGLGRAGKLASLARRAMTGPVRPEGFLMLVPSGDEDAWLEIKEIYSWIEEEAPDVAVRTWVFSAAGDITRERAKKEMVALLDEQLSRS